MTENRTHNETGGRKHDEKGGIRLRAWEAILLALALIFSASAVKKTAFEVFDFYPLLFERQSVSAISRAAVEAAYEHEGAIAVFGEYEYTYGDENV